MRRPIRDSPSSGGFFLRHEQLSINGVDINIPEKDGPEQLEWAVSPHRKVVRSRDRRTHRGISRHKIEGQYGRIPDSWGRHGFSQHAYDEMLAAQGGGCAICGRSPQHRLRGRSVRTRLALDHDHTSGAIRGLLCERCNLTIGRFEDRPELLEAAAVYLRKHGKG